MKKTLCLLLAVSCFAACQEEELSPEFRTDSNVLYSCMESIDATRTSMDEYNNVLWSENDQLVAFMKTTLGIKYQIKEQYVGTTTGGFSKVQGSDSGDDIDPGQVIDHNVVVYPYSDQVWCMKYDSSTPAKSYKLNVVLPETQTYAENSFANGAFPMVAVSSSNQLSFKNICGGLKLQFKGVRKIKSIKFEGLGDELISGKSSLIAYADGSAPTITMASTASTSVTLDCGDGVQLNESTPATFIIAVPPTEFKSGMKITVTDTDGLSKTLTNTSANTIKRSSLLNFPVITYEPSAPDPEPSPEAVNLSEEGTANSYIVSEAGSYKFTPTKGNSSESVGTIASVETLWETFGTDVVPNVGDLVKNVKYADGVISFATPDTFKEGNAVIAAKDASGNILWSWHIWLTDEPQGQVYYNNAGTMMDRNLGATSATPGDVGALGLLYQWGRKDPFRGSSNISSNTVAKSTGSWPSAVTSSSSKGTIDYAVKNPTTFITYNYSNYDWYYTGSSSTDNTRWTTSASNKSIYDPCPAGWRVPDGGSNGVWSKALGSNDNFSGYPYDGTNEGMNFSGKFGSAATIWYPASGFRFYKDGRLNNVSDIGFYWSASTYNDYGYDGAYRLDFIYNGDVHPSYNYYRASGQSVRCLQE